MKKSNNPRLKLASFMEKVANNLDAEAEKKAPKAKVAAVRYKAAKACLKVAEELLAGCKSKKRKNKSKKTKRNKRG